MKRITVNDVYLGVGLICLTITGCFIQSRYGLSPHEIDVNILTSFRSARIQIPFIYYMFNVSGLMVMYNFCKIHSIIEKIKTIIYSKHHSKD